MGWLSAAMFATNFVGGLITGNQQADATRDANKLQEKINKQQFERDLQLWEIDYLQSVSDWSWKMAETEAQRYQDRIRKQDYEFNQALTIDAAVQNLQLNMDIIEDDITGKIYLKSTVLRH